MPFLQDGIPNLSPPMMKLLLLVAAVAVAAADYTYPECSSTGTGCCDFGTGSMRNRGYVVMEIDDVDIIVTCKNGTLSCAEGNPGNTAVASARETVTCPDFEEIMESRSTVTYLEGVTATSTATTTSEDDESGPGTVSAAD